MELLCGNSLIHNYDQGKMRYYAGGNLRKVRVTFSYGQKIVKLQSTVSISLHSFKKI